MVTVVALEDCTSAVTKAPVAKAWTGRPVNRIKARRSLSAANAFRPSVRSVIPRRNRPMPPNSV
jgi:hypothetical protein